MIGLEPQQSPDPSDDTVAVLLRASRLSRPSHAISTVVNDTNVVHNLKTGKSHALNETGGRVWALLGEGTTLDAVVRAIRHEYGVPDATPDPVELDVLKLLMTLRDADLLVAGDSTPIAH